MTWLTVLASSDSGIQKVAFAVPLVSNKFPYLLAGKFLRLSNLPIHLGFVMCLFPSTIRVGVDGDSKA